MAFFRRSRISPTKYKKRKNTEKPPIATNKSIATNAVIPRRVSTTDENGNEA